MAHMNSGNGGTSYAKNSVQQKIGISKSLHILDETLKNMFTNGSFPTKCFRMADLGCSSGPNTLFVVSHIIEEIEELCKDVSEFEVFLNDLPENDFNNVFKLLPSFYEKLNYDHGKRIKYFVSGLPGTFYGRLLPSQTVNFVYSSNSLHWLSQTPEGLENNRDNIYMTTTSPPDVYKAYAKQYQRDFSTFLRSRGEEMLRDGRMVLTFIGRSVEDQYEKDDIANYKLLADTLLDMVAEGHVKEGDLHSFNVPLYRPCKQEVESVIQQEGSFSLDRIEDILVPRDSYVKHENVTNQDNEVSDEYKRGKEMANRIRAYIEPLLDSHFGSSIMDDLFRRFGMKLAEHLSREEPSFMRTIVVCLTKT
ncbi:hypothetical protein BUALT_Bualt19G0030700 [Buddleja alternifolia]|uniref:Uncharacterized protein n=1 Tax=Buddleja alternifolia TaxID=168488 RepID=A0AAV6W560_9LAMI|nr:hypothetical protein BUALT_Bualt19G0030700 [Buddleja alternifolia]